MTDHKGHPWVITSIVYGCMISSAVFAVILAKELLLKPKDKKPKSGGIVR